MTQITLDPSTVSRFEGARERAAVRDPAVRDPAGRVIGYFEPINQPLRASDIHIPFSDEEIEQFRREPGGRSLDEILRDLESRA
jgi:hypothetical protein